MTEQKSEKKTLVPRAVMPCQPAGERIRNFNEVPLGYTLKEAVYEAKRCLQCKRPSCMKGCPVKVRIPQFIAEIVKGDYAKAYTIIRESNCLPAICGRVCQQEDLCEGACILNAKGQPVAIGDLQRFVSDLAIRGEHSCKIFKGKEGRTMRDDLKVACIGSGPSSLAAADYLAVRGIPVTVFEATSELGGILVSGIPEFRLPKNDVVTPEISALKDLGVTFQTNFIGGRCFAVHDLLKEGYNAIFIGVGANQPNALGIPGEHLKGVMSANEYLGGINLKREDKASQDATSGTASKIIGRKVTVYGAGNVAMDAARVARRMGAESVHIVYRRTLNEMPARHEELEHASEEGVQLLLLSAPIAFKGDAQHNLTGVEIQSMELGEADASGRRSPKAIPGDTYTLETDLAIVAVGTRSNPTLLEATPGLEASPQGYIAVNPETYETSIPNVFSGGDIVTGAASVVQAMGAGRAAAREIAKRLLGEELATADAVL